MNDNRVKWQIDCDNTIREKNNVILSSPTGSGKTKRYEFWALNKPERPIFITSPIKSLSNQKFREFQANGYKVGLETGDIKYIPYNDCDIICCTQEIYNNKYKDYENTTLIIDEFSYIFEDEDRSRVYIDSLKYSRAKNIMLCSASLGNPEKIKQYVEKVTNKDFFLYENKERLTTLEYKGKLFKEDIKDSLVVAYSQNCCRIIANSIYKSRIVKFQDIMRKTSYSNYDPRERNKKEILNIAKKYNIDNEELIELSTIGVVYYYGKLYPKEKLFVEELFEKRLIDTVVGTDALALGVNFPIKNVVFTQLQKTKKQKIVEISKNLFEQLSGRAGRKGFFDHGFVYYCDDFKEDYDNSIKKELNKKNLKDLFFKLVNAENEEGTISLNANIKNILIGKTTIEEEALFITEYSTVDKDYEEEKDKIKKIIDYITSLDIAPYYLKRIFQNLDFEQGYYEALENCSPKFKNRIEKLSDSLTMLQPYFNKDIGVVYATEYTPKQNCDIFIEILIGTSIEKLIKRYCNDFRDMLLLRNYIYKLPEKYSKQYDLSLIDAKIDYIDYTVLHPNEFKIEKVVNTLKKEKIIKSNNIMPYRCPNYFDRILIDGKEYIKILVEGNNILVCDYSEEDNLNLYCIPVNTMYKLVGFIKLNKRLDILNRVNLNSLINNNEEVADKIEGMKLFLKKKRK